MRPVPARPKQTQSSIPSHDSIGTLHAAAPASNQAYNNATGGRSCLTL
ncbi:hypothetical protein HDG34_003403 [Paraburkholderia sp. HC6.4b]|nr:hypothetical protein [Paraburkholderia sp. HC6.4b]MBB5451191.1 hypothetical protein [Paraburkholderia sp. Kb1A]